MKKDIKNTLLQKVENYFNGIEHTVRSSEAADFLLLSVTYHDHRTEPQVKRDLERISPCIIVIRIDRIYSSMAIKNAIELMVTQWLDKRNIDNGIPDLTPNPI